MPVHQNLSLPQDLPLPDSLGLPQMLLNEAMPFLPLLLTVLGFGLLLRFTHWLLIGRHTDHGNEKRFPRQLVMLGLNVIAIIASVLALPVSEGSRNQIIGLIGLVISGVFAFSSGTIFANLMAGILLRVTKPFQIGDFVHVGEHFGRVAERGLFDTEIQSENRELIAIPNTFLITNPISRVLRSGAIVSASLSLGYDCDHADLEPLLIEAAESSGLEEPFVHILELGNYAVTYRVSGILAEVKGLITARSNLFRAILDVLHAHDIEIMSPSFMNQRPQPEGRKAIPPRKRKTAPAGSGEEKVSTLEDIVFDRAEQAEKLYSEKQKLENEIEQLEKAIKEEKLADMEKQRLKEDLAQKREQLKIFSEAAAKVAEKAEEAERNGEGTENLLALATSGETRLPEPTEASVTAKPADPVVVGEEADPSKPRQPAKTD